MQYQCIQCKHLLVLPLGGIGKVQCDSCQSEYEFSKNYLRTNFDRLLFQKYKKHYLLNKVLNNNGFLSYHFLKEGSLSLKDRTEVVNFKKFILPHVSKGKLLDIGCGVMEMPGYLDFDDTSPFEFFGLDPIDDKSFRGMRVVSCSEFTPFPDETFDAVIFGTSLDHVCSLEQTLAESYRILGKSGKILIWMSDLKTRRRMPLRQRVYAKFRLLKENVKAGYRTDRFIIYPNFTVLYVPKGAVDPFHTYHEQTSKIIPLVENAGFRLIDRQEKSDLEVFLCFSKTDKNLP